MHTTDISRALAVLFSELTHGAPNESAFVLNGGDQGLLCSLDGLSAADASRAVDDGATIAAHVRHVRYGLSLMNRWAGEGGNPFASADWGEAWQTTAVDERTWQEIQRDLKAEADEWLAHLRKPREVSDEELAGMMGSVVHLGYHLGAIRQIAKGARGPKEGAPGR